MNQLTISNIKFAGGAIKLEELSSYLKKRMEKCNIICDIKVKKDMLEVVKNSEKKLFMSTKVNYIPLKAGDKRIKDKGRDYLESERLTEKQLLELKRIFSDYLDMIHVSCSIKLYNKEDNFVELRDVSCNNYINRWPAPTSFPLERN